MLLVLGGRRPVAHGVVFWAAWTIGVAAPTIAFVVAAERADLMDDDLTAIAIAEIAIGFAFLVVAARLAFERRRVRSASSPPWVDALDRTGPLCPAVLALILSSGNPKNLALMLAAVAIVQDGDVTSGAAGFVALAVSSVSLLLVGYVALADRSRSTLVRLRDSVARNDRTFAMVAGLVVGAFFLAEGTGSL
jgi:threonine/homoserine/homoserine lactone efflux protein